MPSHQDLCTRRAGWRVVGAIGLGAMLWAVGCFKPAIVDGGLRCGPAETCPDGMFCVADRCYAKGSGKIPTDATTDTNDGGPDNDAGPMCERKTTPPSGCTVQTDLDCDPVCQTGCCPDEKCTALNDTAVGATAATLGCSRLMPARKFLEACDPNNAGTSSRSDNCEAGLACVDGDGGAVCLKLCRNDGDCSDGTRCEQRKLDRQGTAVTSVCGLPPMTCTPTLLSNNGCPTGRTCYLVDINATGGDRTICDITAGQGKQMASCRYARDCLPRFTCANTGSGVGRCWPTCALADGACPGVTQCKNVGQTYGYCD